MNNNARKGMEILVFASGTLLQGVTALHAAEMEQPFTHERNANTLSSVVLEEIVITGSRLRSAAGEGAAPVLALDRAQIVEMGASTVSETLQQVTQQSYNFVEGRNFGGAQHAELRGLGADTTLVLINGRRAVASAPSVSSNAFDLNTIPLAAVERIEVLSDSASAVYGADAMGGVVNVILRKEIPRPVLELRFGGADGGGEERRISLSSGYSNERLRTSLVLDHYERDVLLGEERERWRDQDFRRYGGQDRRSTSAAPGTVSSPTTANLPGVSASMAAVPIGSTGVGLTPADFAATAGERHLESLRRYWSIVPEAERGSAAAFAEFDVSSSVTAFAEVFYTDRTSDSQSEPSSLSRARVPAANPFNPFGIDVNVDLLLTGVGPRTSVVEADALRAVAGVRGELKRWEWEVSVLDTDEDGTSWTQNAVDPARMSAALAATDPALAFNPFQDGPGASDAVLASLLAEPVINRYTSKSTQVSAFARGGVFTLPAGEVDVVIGGEWREEEMLQDTAPVVVASDRDVKALFAEARVPLVSDSMQWPGVHRLALTAAARYDEYSDFGNTLNPQYGIAWNLTPDLLLRGTYGTGFRPPSLFELYAPRSTSIGRQVIDPRRNGETTSVTTLSGGNPDLDPLEADSLTTGFVWTPRVLDGVRVAASYWRVEVEERVATFLPQLVLENEERFSERVLREAPTPADVAAGVPGRIVSIDASRVNFGLLETSGVDVQLSYIVDTPIGRFAPSVAATWVEKYEAVQVPNTPPVERVGIANTSGTIPKWRGTATLRWSKGALASAVTARYVDGYQDATLSGTPVEGEIPSQTLIDAQLSFEFDEIAGLQSSWLRGVRLAGGVINAFDEAPHFTIMSSSGYDLSQGDLRQRFVYLNLGKTF